MIGLVRALAVLVEPPAPGQDAVAAALELPPPEPWEHHDLFDTQLYPYASVYLGAEGMLGGEARDRAAGVWRALERTPPPEPDHLATLLGLYAELGALEAADAPPGGAAWADLRDGLLHEHLASWLPPWLSRVAELGGATYRGWARLLDDWLAQEVAERNLPATLPVQLQSAPVLEPPDEVGGEGWIDQLLVAVRTGMVLARDDLARAARESGLGLRVGERRWVLKALVGQDPGASLAWLAGEAARQAELPGRAIGAAGDAFWRARAAATRAALEAAAGTVG